MKSFVQFAWPVGVIVLLAVMALRRGGTGMENPLGDQRLQEWSSVSRR